MGTKFYILDNYMFSEDKEAIAYVKTKVDYYDIQEIYKEYIDSIKPPIVINGEKIKASTVAQKLSSNYSDDVVIYFDLFLNDVWGNEKTRIAFLKKHNIAYKIEIYDDIPAGTWSEKRYLWEGKNLNSFWNSMLNANLNILFEFYESDFEKEINAKYLSITIGDIVYPAYSVLKNVDKDNYNYVFKDYIRTRFIDYLKSGKSLTLSNGCIINFSPDENKN